MSEIILTVETELRSGNPVHPVKPGQSAQPITPDFSHEEGLPQGVGTFGRRWMGAVALLCLLICFGIYSYAQQRIHGDIVTGMRTVGDGGAAWGLYISFYVIFVGFAFGGIAITTLAHLFHLRRFHIFCRNT